MAASPWLVRVADLTRDPGSRRDIDITAHLPDEPLGTSAASTAGPVTMTGHVEGMAGGVTITSTLVVRWTGACRRCLDPVDDYLVVEVREVAQPTPVDDDVYPIAGDLLDLEPVARELILANLPLAPLCGDDCAGPAPDIVAPSIGDAPPPDDEAETAGPAPDPRWAALDDLDLG